MAIERDHRTEFRADITSAYSGLCAGDILFLLHRTINTVEVDVIKGQAYLPPLRVIARVAVRGVVNEAPGMREGTWYSMDGVGTEPAEGVPVHICRFGHNDIVIDRRDEQGPGERPDHGYRIHHGDILVVVRDADAVQEALALDAAEKATAATS